jgi:hypothetical protein
MTADGPDAAAAAPRRRGSRVLLCLLAVGVLAGGLAAVLLTHHASSEPHQTPTPVKVAVAAPTTSAAPAPSPARTSAVPHDHVSASAPSSFVYAGRGFTIRARVCGMPYVRPLDPPGEQHHTVCWVREGFGVAPGSNSGTTYVLGHAWARDPNEVLNRASSLATREVLHGHARPQDGIDLYPVRRLLGDRITLRTAHGTLTYTVRTAYGVRKDEAGNYPHLMDERIRNRVVLITCAERHGVDYDYNIIVEAYLTSARALADRG